MNVATKVMIGIGSTLAVAGVGIAATALLNGGHEADADKAADPRTKLERLDARSVPESVSTAWLAGEYLARYDSNGDGSINTATESVRQLAERFGTRDVTSRTFFTTVDAFEGNTQDGVVEREELKRYADSFDRGNAENHQDNFEREHVTVGVDDGQLSGKDTWGDPASWAEDFSYTGVPDRGEELYDFLHTAGAERNT